ncbi:hypothetical protein, partial [Providencia rustigianii]|uniref:hypothetical protein n=1 Tax=Providencia rustigianii TaxID=158850 RepID=UPI00223F2CDC
MKINAQLISEFLINTEWHEAQQIRLFWVKINHTSRNNIAQEVIQLNDNDVILPLILRDSLFMNANAVLSDFVKLIENNRSEFDKVSLKPHGRLTILLLLKDDFKLSQVSSPVHLPHWFPILGGLETFLKISNLIQTAEVNLLHCPEAKIETLAQVLYDLENMMVQRLLVVANYNINKVRSIIGILYQEKSPDTKTPNHNEAILSFEEFLNSVNNPKAYRVNSTKKNSLVSLLLNKILKSSPDQLASLANKIGEAFDDKSEEVLKPTLFAIMLRPSNKVNHITRNWHSILLSCFQVYQLTNASAHAGEYPS